MPACRRAQASEPDALTAVKEALRQRAVPRSRSTPALQRLANGDASPRPPGASGAASEAGSSSNDPSMHSADDVLSARSSLPLHQDFPISTSSQLGGDFQPVPSGFSWQPAADRGIALTRGADHREAREPNARWGKEDSVGGEGRRPVRNVHVRFPDEQEPAREEEEPVYHLDLRPFMDLAPPCVRQAPDCSLFNPNAHSL